MAEKKPPSGATRKTSAKRGPTKAAALKALGLTQEDLDLLKERREFLQQPAPPQAQAPVAQHSIDRATAVDFASTEEPVFYARNVRHVEVGFRLTRQTKQGEKRTQLKPRGSRGDMIRLESSDLKDPELQTQVEYGLIEIIPEGEALGAIKRQYTNAQQEVPAHIAMLTNAMGEKLYPDQIKFASEEEAYGIKVADLDPALMQGRLSDKEIKRDGGFTQNAQQTPPGGNSAIISDGFIAPAQGDGTQMGNNDQRSQQIDALARSKQFEGPGAGLGEVTVKVEPVRRVQ